MNSGGPGRAGAFGATLTESSKYGRLALPDRSVMYCFQQHRQLVPGLSAILLAALAGCGPIGGAQDSEEGAETAEAAADSARTDTTAGAVPVQTRPVVRGDISSALVFSSTIETEDAVEIHPEVSGRVERVAVEEGDQVAAGDLLVRLDAEQARLEDRESEVDLRQLESSFGRTEEMFGRGLISTQEYEDQQFELERARLRRERAGLALSHTAIRAPFSGVITSRGVQTGARVSPAVKLFDLVKLDDMIARVHVPGRYLMQVSIGQPATVSSDFLEDVDCPAYVKRISPVVDPRSGTFKVTVGVQDPWRHLRPGIFVTVRVVTGTHARAVLVPKEAVVYEADERYVFVVEGGTARRLRLDAGYENADFVEALSGLSAGADVIVVGQKGLRDQASVKVVNPPAPPAG